MRLLPFASLPSLPSRPSSAIRRSFGALVLVGAIGLGACGGDDGNGGRDAPADDVDAAATVELKPTTFEPEDVTISAGETVLWEWDGGVQHDVEGEGFESEVKSSGTFTHTFEEPGTFEYLCNVHPTTMKGTVTVE